MQERPGFFMIYLLSDMALIWLTTPFLCNDRPDGGFDSRLIRHSLR